LKKPKRLPDIKRGGLNTFHNKMDKPSREPQELKEITEKEPLDRIKCLSKINLDGTTRGDMFPPILS
jgi:hypothetical protein